MLIPTVLLAVPTPGTLHGGSHTALQAAQIFEGFRQQRGVASSIGICQGGRGSCMGYWCQSLWEMNILYGSSVGEVWRGLLSGWVLTRSSGVCAEGKGEEATADSCPRARRGSPGEKTVVKGISRRSVGCPCAHQARCKLVKIRLAHHHTACMWQPPILEDGTQKSFAFVALPISCHNIPNEAPLSIQLLWQKAPFSWGTPTDHDRRHSMT